MEEVRVKPFSSGTEYMGWRWNNCDKCKKCNDQTSKREDTCPMEYDLSFGYISDGTIPFSSAQRIGCSLFVKSKYGNFLDLDIKCKELEA